MGKEGRRRRVNRVGRMWTESIVVREEVGSAVKVSEACDGLWHKVIR